MKRALVIKLACALALAVVGCGTTDALEDLEDQLGAGGADAAVEMPGDTPGGDTTPGADDPGTPTVDDTPGDTTTPDDGTTNTPSEGATWFVANGRTGVKLGTIGGTMDTVTEDLSFLNERRLMLAPDGEHLILGSNVFAADGTLVGCASPGCAAPFDFWDSTDGFAILLAPEILGFVGNDKIIYSRPSSAGGQSGLYWSALDGTGEATIAEPGHELSIVTRHFVSPDGTHIAASRADNLRSDVVIIELADPTNVTEYTGSTLSFQQVYWTSNDQVVWIETVGGATNSTFYTASPDDLANPTSLELDFVVDGHNLWHFPGDKMLAAGKDNTNAGGDVEYYTIDIDGTAAAKHDQLSALELELHNAQMNNGANLRGMNGLATSVSAGKILYYTNYGQSLVLNDFDGQNPEMLEMLMPGQSFVTSDFALP